MVTTSAADGYHCRGIKRSLATESILPDNLRGKERMRLVIASVPE